MKNHIRHTVRKLELVRLRKLISVFSEKAKKNVNTSYKEISYKCFEVKIICPAACTTGYGRSENEAEKNGIKNFFDILLDDEKYAELVQFLVLKIEDNGDSKNPDTKKEDETLQIENVNWVHEVENGYSSHEKITFKFVDVSHIADSPSKVEKKGDTTNLLELNDILNRMDSPLKSSQKKKINTPIQKSDNRVAPVLRQRTSNTPSAPFRKKGNTNKWRSILTGDMERKKRYDSERGIKPEQYLDSMLTENQNWKDRTTAPTSMLHSKFKQNKLLQKFQKELSKENKRSIINRHNSIGNPYKKRRSHIKTEVYELLGPAKEMIEPAIHTRIQFGECVDKIEDAHQTAMPGRTSKPCSSNKLNDEMGKRKSSSCKRGFLLNNEFWEGSKRSVSKRSKESFRKSDCSKSPPKQMKTTLNYQNEKIDEFMNPATIRRYSNDITKLLTVQLEQQTNENKILRNFLSELGFDPIKIIQEKTAIGKDSSLENLVIAASSTTPAHFLAKINSTGNIVQNKIHANLLLKKKRQRKQGSSNAHFDQISQGNLSRILLRNESLERFKIFKECSSRDRILGKGGAIEDIESRHRRMMSNQQLISFQSKLPS